MIYRFALAQVKCTHSNCKQHIKSLSLLVGTTVERIAAETTFGNVDKNGRLTFERIHNTKEQIILYERAETHRPKERTILSFKRALFPGNDQVMTSQVQWLKHSFWFHFLCPSDVEDSFCEDVHSAALPEDHCCSKYADYLFEFKLCNISLEIPSRNVGLNPTIQQEQILRQNNFVSILMHTSTPPIQHFFVFLDSFKST